MFTGKGFASFVSFKAFQEAIEKTVEDARNIRPTMDGVEATFETIGDLLDLLILIFWDAAIACIRTYVFFKEEHVIKRIVLITAFCLMWIPYAALHYGNALGTILIYGSYPVKKKKEVCHGAGS